MRWIEARLRTRNIYDSRIRNTKARKMNGMRRMLRTAAKQRSKIRERNDEKEDRNKEKNWE
jgi:hypothetical protein